MDDMRAGIDQPALQRIRQEHDRSLGGERWRQAGPQAMAREVIDLSIEKYFKKRSYVAVAGFLKKLDSFIYERPLQRFQRVSRLELGPDGRLPADDNQLQSESRHNHFAGQWHGRRVYGGEVSTSLDGSLISPSLEASA